MDNNPKYLSSVITYIVSLRKHYQRHVYWRFQWMQVCLSPGAPKPTNRPRPENYSQMNLLAQQIIVGLGLAVRVPETLAEYGKFILHVEQLIIQNSDQYLPQPPEHIHI